MNHIAVLRASTHGMPYVQIRRDQAPFLKEGTLEQAGMSWYCLRTLRIRDERSGVSALWQIEKRAADILEQTPTPSSISMLMALDEATLPAGWPIRMSVIAMIEMNDSKMVSYSNQSRSKELYQQLDD